MSGPRVGQVVAAEARRRWSVHPLSTFTSTVVFPALMVASLFYLPRADFSHRRFGLRELAVTVEGAPGKGGPPPWARAALERLADQPVFTVQVRPDAVGAFEAGQASAAIVLRQDAGAVRAEVHRKDDLVSELLTDRLSAPMVEAAHPTFVKKGGGDEIGEESRANLARVGLFVLLGFGWFFVSSGIIERLVSERERRSLEVLLASPVEAAVLLRGRLSEITLNALLPQAAASLALLLLGFPATSLMLPLLVALGIYPVALAVFVALKDAPDTQSAGWKVGTVFMFAFPSLILVSDVLGPLSPLYRLGTALTGAIAWDVTLPVTLALALLNALGWALTPSVAKRWRL